MRLRKQGLAYVLIAIVGTYMAITNSGFGDLWNQANGVAAYLTRIHPEDIIITPERRQHILYGDETGGGHFHTANKPCKSEFPENWDEERIMETIRLIASNHKIEWRVEDNGYEVAESGGLIHTRVVKKGNRIITAYPVNVEPNPCPGRKPANDNYNQ